MSLVTDTKKPLGRKEPTDFTHLERYGLLLAAHPEVLGQPLFFGVNWYAAFDVPEAIEIGGRTTYWIGRGNNWGRVRGGHEICAKPIGLVDNLSWYRYYRQTRNSCVGFALSRGMSLLNRRKYNADWLYDEALKVDEWPGEADEGTSGRAGFDVLRTQGHRRKWGPFTLPARLADGIEANRWLTNVDDVLSVLGTANLHGGCVPLLNSWGADDYPHIVYVPAEAIGRLMVEGGDCGAVTDR
jgi:hypothetical protein